MQNDETSICRRGILSLVSGDLLCNEYDRKALVESAAAMRRRRSCGLSYRSEKSTETYNPARSEWTLFFVASSTNLYSIQFRTILVDFCQENIDKVQCICIPNEEQDDELLLCGTGFYCLPWSHENRGALIHLLGISQVPMVVVVSNKQGRRITDQGIAVIEAKTPQVFEKWRKGESGLGVLQWASSTCGVS
jgi:hypothetical protein